MSTVLPAALADRAARVITLATQLRLRVATVETVTGGLIAYALTETPGASAVFERGFVLYHADAKGSGLGVDPAVAATHGAVSGEVTAALADALAEASEADVGVGITGYAGPTGGNARNPIGTVYVAGFDRVGPASEASRLQFDGDRSTVKIAAAAAALDLLAARLGERGRR